MKLEISLDEVIVKVEDAKIKIKPLDIFTLHSIQQKYMKKGKITDESGLAAEILENSIIGWENLQDAKGNKIEFSKEKIRPLITALSMKDQSILEKLLNAAKSLLNEAEYAKKKSEDG